MFFKELSFSLTVVELFEHFQNYPYSFLLDSANTQHEFGHYSFLGFSPFLVFKSKGRKIEIISPQKRKFLEGNPWEILEKLFSRYQMNSTDEYPPFPFTSGVVGYFSYDLGRYLEKVPDQARDDLNLPECYLGFYDRVIIFDHWEKKSWICATGLREKNKKLQKNCA
ncbi:MAG TPA: aminodeoxychorismate synthase, component I, partial [Elusimicrobia bacterium]|nr:aminodeoxychorismate synthase, component I [Elusimicrobiota bacterium]